MLFTKKSTRAIGALIVSVLALGMLALTLTAGTFAHAASFSYPELGASSADSGTCGNFWAHDNYGRQYDASDSVLNPSTLSPATVTETFLDGTFTTTTVPYGVSPGSCDLGSPGVNHPVYAHIPGNFSGTETITVTSGKFDPNGCVDGNYEPPSYCTTLTGGTNSQATQMLIKALYGPESEFSVTSFNLVYTACTTGQGFWNNAGDNVGVLFNSGDISGMASQAVNPNNAACPQPPPPPTVTPAPTEPPAPTTVPTTPPVTTPTTPGLPNTGSD